MKVAIVSFGNKDYFLGNQTLVDSIPDSFEYFSFDKQKFRRYGYRRKESSYR